MEINKTFNEGTLFIGLKGRLDTITAPSLENELNDSLPGVTKLILDCAALEYVSSAGLRVILAVQKVMNRQGKMIVKNVNDTIMEVFEITGFLDLLTIE